MSIPLAICLFTVGSIKVEGSGQWLKQEPTINLLTKTSLSCEAPCFRKNTLSEERCSNCQCRERWWTESRQGWKELWNSNILKRQCWSCCMERPIYGPLWIWVIHYGHSVMALLHQSRGCELGDCCLKTQTKSRAILDLLLFLPVPSPVWFNCCSAPSLSPSLLQHHFFLPLLLFSFAVVVILFIIESLTLYMSVLGSRVHWD